MRLDLDAEPAPGADPPDGPPHGPLPPGPPPRGLSPASVVGIVLAGCLGATGAILFHDAVVLAGWAPGALVSVAAVRSVDGLAAGTWAVTAGLAAMLVGLWLVFAVARPRPLRGYRIAAATGVYLRLHDAGLIVEHTASAVNGVLAAHAHPSRRRILLELDTTGDDRTVSEVRDLVERRLAPLDGDVQLKIVTRVVSAPRRLTARRRG